MRLLLRFNQTQKDVCVHAHCLRDEDSTKNRENKRPLIAGFVEEKKKKGEASFFVIFGSGTFILSLCDKASPTLLLKKKW